MSDTVKEFMEKPTQKFACGRDARETTGTLQKAFVASSKRKAGKEKEAFAAILEPVMKTARGRETMEALADLGYKFRFENGNFGGMCCSSEKTILLNPNYDSNYIAHVLVHEGRHAIQYSRTPENAPELEQTKVADMFRMRQAIEADACAHQAAFVYECKTVAPKVYSEYKAGGFPMLTAYETELDRTGDKRKAMQAAFKSWYDFPYYRDLYDEYYKDNGIKAMAEIGKQQKNPTLFSKEYPVRDVVDLCVFQGKPYMTADWLNSDKPNALTAEAKREIKAVLADYVKAVPGAKSDMSINKMATRDKDGKILEPAKMASNAAVLAKFTQGRGC